MEWPEMELLYAYQEWAYAETFRISRSAKANSELFVVYIRDGTLIGRGECGLLPQYGESKDDVTSALEQARDLVANGATRSDISAKILNSSARNALDCALWDLECKRAGQDVWKRTGLSRAESIEVDITIGISSTAKMREAAIAASEKGYRLLKIKADRDDILDKVSVISEACSGIQLIIDANEAWDISTLNKVAPRLKQLGVCLIEQPLHHQADSALADYTGTIPLCADESCSSIDDLPRLSALYQAINIKLDKVGGLTPGLELNREARMRGLKIMLGCSGPTSLGAAPAYVLASLCDFVDLDGPALLLEDRSYPMCYRNGRLYCFSSALWGG